MKGVILAGGTGSRLYPLTRVISKQLLPINDKPMIFYPLSVLILAGITEILIITTTSDQEKFENLLGDGSDFGITLSYATQAAPRGIADAFLVGESFIEDSDIALILGDNIFYGNAIGEFLYRSIQLVETTSRACIFATHVADPKHFGVVEFDSDRHVKSIEEKPSSPKSNYAVTGLYLYPNDVIEKAKKLVPSARGELEITSINEAYLKDDRLSVQLLSRGYAWLDTGTHANLLEASKFIDIVERRQGLKIGCLEEVAFERGLISQTQLLKLADKYRNTEYGAYLIARATASRPY